MPQMAHFERSYRFVAEVTFKNNNNNTQNSLLKIIKSRKARLNNGSKIGLQIRNLSGEDNGAIWNSSL